MDLLESTGKIRYSVLKVTDINVNFNHDKHPKALVCIYIVLMRSRLCVGGGGGVGRSDLGWRSEKPLLLLRMEQ